jgi:hypothetical protein
MKLGATFDKERYANTNQARNRQRVDERGEPSPGILYRVVVRADDRDTGPSSIHTDRGSAQHDRPVLLEFHLHGCRGGHKCGLVMGLGTGTPSNRSRVALGLRLITAALLISPFAAGFLAMLF